MSNTYYGADISQYQGDIDWPAFDPGAAFVFIKAGGGDAGLYTDTKLERNKAGVRALGTTMPHGYYWFAGGGAPAVEADYFCNIMADLQFGEVLALDWEISPGFDHDAFFHVSGLASSLIQYIPERIAPVALLTSPFLPRSIF